MDPQRVEAKTWDYHPVTVRISRTTTVSGKKVHGRIGFEFQEGFFHVLLQMAVTKSLNASLAGNKTQVFCRAGGVTDHNISKKLHKTWMEATEEEFYGLLGLLIYMGLFNSIQFNLLFLIRIVEKVYTYLAVTDKKIKWDIKGKVSRSITGVLTIMDMFRLRLSESVLTIYNIINTCLNEQQVTF